MYRLVGASFVSRVGTQITVVAAPLAALTMLNATTFEVGLLGAAEFFPFLIFGLHAGALVDRHRRQLIMMTCDALRALIMGFLVIAAVTTDLRLWHLYLALFGIGTLSVFFEVATQSHIPSLVAPNELARATGAFVTGDALAATSGPSFGGLLVHAVGAVAALFVDGVTYLVSALILWRMDRSRETRAAARQPGDSTASLIRAGLKYVTHHPHLRPIALCTANASLFGTMALSVMVTYLVRELGFGAGRVGIILALGNVGIVIGATIGPRLLRTYAGGSVLCMSALAAGLCQLAVGLVPRSGATVSLTVAWASAMMFITVLNLAQATYRQTVTAPEMRGRMNATVRMAISGTVPFGFIAGALLGGAIGLKSTLVVAGAGATLSFLWLVLSPVRGLQVRIAS